MTPYQRIIQAYEQGTGCWLTKQDVAALAFDAAIRGQAMNDSLRDSIERALAFDAAIRGQAMNDSLRDSIEGALENKEEGNADA